MCGRTEINTEWSELAAALGIPLPTRAPPELTLPALNVPPTATVPVAVVSAGARTLTTMRWGFPSVWADKPWCRPRFNARAEAAARKAMWSAPLNTRRCLVPVTGFYEWVGPKRARVPLRFSSPGGVFTLAGVWGRFERDGAEVDCVCILTTAASDAVRPIHARMPAILGERSWETWLDATVPARGVASMLRPWGGALSIEEVTLKRAA